MAAPIFWEIPLCRVRYNQWSSDLPTSGVKDLAKYPYPIDLDEGHLSRHVVGATRRQCQEGKTRHYIRGILSPQSPRFLNLNARFFRVHFVALHPPHVVRRAE